MKKNSPPLSRLSYFDLMAVTRHYSLHPGGIQSTRKLLRACQIRPNMKLLEVGCGTGFTSCLIAKRFKCHVWGIDKNLNMIQAAKDRARRAGLLYVHFQEGNGSSLPFKNQSFDVVICEGSTSFFKNKTQVANEYFRVLKKNGILGEIEFYYKKKPRKILIQALQKKTKSYVEVMSFQDWLALYCEVGFKLCQVSNYECQTANKHDISIYVQEVVKTLKNKFYRADQKELEAVSKGLTSIQKLFNENRSLLNYAIWTFKKTG